MAFSPLGPQKPVQHVKGKAPQRSSQAPKSPIGPELGTLPVDQRAREQRGHGGAKQEKARIGVDFNTATSMWGGYKQTTEKMIKSQGTPDYTELSAAREASLKDLHSKVSPRVAEFGKAWGVAAIKGASGNRQMQQYAAQMDKMVGDFINRGANFAENKRLAANPTPSPRERSEAQTKVLHQNQAAAKRNAESLARADKIKQKRKSNGS